MQLMPFYSLTMCPRIGLDAPLVAIIMGSDSDLPVMKDAAEILKTFDVPFEVVLTNIQTHIHK